jgi:hypothetical protein
MDNPYTIHVIATDTNGGYGTQAIAVNVYMAVSSATDASATLPYTSGSWSFSPHAAISGGLPVGDGFYLTHSNPAYSSVQLSLSDAVRSVEFTSGSLALSNDGTTGTITDSSTSGNSILISSGTVENTLIKVLSAPSQTITGTTDSELDTGFGALTNYRDDTLQITETAFGASTFSMNTDGTLKIAFGTAVKTVSDVEAVKFTDHTVRIVGAHGYDSFAEAMNQDNTSHANVGDYIYSASAPTEVADSTHLDRIGITDFYVYHG